MPFRSLRAGAYALKHPLARFSPQICLPRCLRIAIAHQRWSLPHARFNHDTSLVEFNNRPVDLTHFSTEWLVRHRPSPYIIIYEAVEAQKPEIISSFSDLVLEEDIIVGEGSDHSPKHRPGAFEEAILLRYPNSAAIIAKVIRRQDILSSLSKGSDDTTISEEEQAAADAHATQLIYNERELSYMSRLGYTLPDIKIWASILLEASCKQAVKRLNEYMFGTDTTKLTQPKIVPITVITVLLNRLGIDAQSLQTLLTCTWYVLRLRPFGHSRSKQYLKIFHNFTRVAVRLWPDCLPNLASLLIIFLPQSWSPDWKADNAEQTSSELEHSDTARVIINESMNAAIQMLSVAGGVHPFRTSIHQEKAQFMILSHMVGYDPPLHVDSDAYAALIKVQLRRGRTPQEEEWAALQARSWPPYPKPKTAMDEDKGFSFGSSRAIRTMSHMRQAGYELSDWEQVARIFAGWDTDMTPTVQTRVAYLATHTAVCDMSFESRACAARIMTARDVREAWALFLQNESAGLQPSILVYAQMFRKLAEEDRRLKNEVGRPLDDNIVSGAFKEVRPPATSPMQKIFVSSEPPSFMQLFEHMLQQDFEYPPWFVGSLLSCCATLQQAVEVWSRTPHERRQTALLMSAWRSGEGPNTMITPEFRGLARLVSRFPTDPHFHTLLDQRSRHAVYTWLLKSMRPHLPDHAAQVHIIDMMGNWPVWQMAYLARKRKITQPAVWHSLLQGVLRLLYETDTRRPPAHYLFGPVSEIMSAMRDLQVALNDEIFSDICQFLDHAGRSALRRQYAMQTDALNMQRGSDWSNRAAGQVTSYGSLLLRRQFAALCASDVNQAALDRSTAGSGAENWIPRAVHTPSPLICQRYIRALAVHADYEGLYSFARWLASHEADMAASLKQVPRAAERWAVVLTAFRVALEAPRLMLYNFPVEGLRRPSPELVALVRATLEGMTELGGWATEEQMHEYGAFVRANADQRHVEAAMGMVPDRSQRKDNTWQEN